MAAEHNALSGALGSVGLDANALEFARNSGRKVRAHARH
jgi:hypothetical protein